MTNVGIGEGREGKKEVFFFCRSGGFRGYLDAKDVSFVSHLEVYYCT